MKEPLILLFTRDRDFARSVREAVSETGATVLVARDVRDGLQIADVTDSAASSTNRGLTKPKYYESNYRSEFSPSVC